MSQELDADEFMAALGERLRKRPAEDVLVCTKEAANELLGFLPVIIMREEPGKRPKDAIVIELTGERGCLVIFYRGHEIEFRK